MIEEFKEIPGYNGYYLISNYGRVKAPIRKNRIGSILQQTMLKTFMNKGSLKVNLFRNKIQSTYEVAKLVARTFDPNWSAEDNKITFIDSNPKNCRFDNLKIDGVRLYSPPIEDNVETSQLVIEKEVVVEPVLQPAIREPIVTNDSSFKIVISGGTSKDIDDILNIFRNVTNVFDIDVISKLSKSSNDVTLSLKRILEEKIKAECITVLSKPSSPTSVSYITNQEIDSKVTNEKPSTDKGKYKLLPAPYNAYSINDTGDVIRNKNGRRKKMKLVKQYINGTPNVQVKLNNKYTHVRSACLMILLHDGIDPKKIKTIRYKDGNKSNLHYDNLIYSKKE